MPIINSRQNLQRYLSQKTGTEQQTQLQKWADRIRGKPFWLDVDSETHRQAFKDSNGDCCAWHIWGEPKRSINGKDVRTPVFDYQLDIIRLLNSGTRRICINKSSSTGISELLTVRWLAWKCLTNSEWSGQTCAIINAPRMSGANLMINRIRNLFSDVIFTERESRIKLGNTVIESYPSHRALPALRGIDRLACCVLEEFDFFNSLEEQIIARNVAERNIGKNNSYILIISTPNRSDFQLAELERENGSGIYTMVRLPYTCALGKMFDNSFIQEAMKTHSFQQEYNLAYYGHIGNLLSPEAIDNCIAEYDINTINPNTVKVAGLDSGFGTSNMALVVCEYITQPVEKIRIIYENQWTRPDFNDVLNEIWYNVIKPYNIRWVKIDGSNPAVVTDLMRRYGDDTYPDYQTAIKRYESMKINWKNNYHCEAVQFQKESREMLSNLKMIVDRGKLQIHPSMTAVITALRSAVEDGKFGLDKTKSLETHEIDALRLALKFYKFK